MKISNSVLECKQTFTKKSRSQKKSGKISILQISSELSSQIDPQDWNWSLDQKTDMEFLDVSGYKKSFAWKHFLWCDEKQTGKCRICGRMTKCDLKYGIGNILRHLKQAHQITKLSSH